MAKILKILGKNQVFFIWLILAIFIYFVIRLLIHYY